MAAKAPHTLFELSILLSSLQKYGVEPKCFHRISSEFFENGVIAENIAVDAARLTPEALESLYLQVLKNDIRAAQQYTAQQTKRKKSPTPPLQNLDEASKHKHLLPGLARRYHTEYVKQVVKQIQEDEKAYTELSQEIELVVKQPQDSPSQKSVTSGDASGAHGKISNAQNDGKPVGQPTFANGSLVEPGNHIGSSLISATNSSSSTQASSGLDQHANRPKDDSLTSAPTRVQTVGESGLSISGTTHIKPTSLSNAAIGATSKSLASSNSHGRPVSSSLNTPRTNEKDRQHSPVVPNSLAGRDTPSLVTPGPGTILDKAGSISSFSTPNPKAPWQTHLPATFTPLPTKLFGNLVTPASLNERRRLQGLPPIDTSQSSTRWKDLPRGAIREGRSPPRPSNSPYLSDSPSPEPVSYNIPSIETGKVMETPTRGSARGLSRGRGQSIKAAGRPSDRIAVSARIRSQSAISAAEDSAAESIAKGMKPEPPATPSFTDETSFVSATGEIRSNTRRRDVPRDGDTPRPTLKRKRADTLDGTPDISSAPKFSRPGQVLASRNFSRVVSALLNDINSHKLASVFAKPITEKSAPGYQDLIYRPQDLKSIRSAISAGSRFVATIPNPDTNNEDVTGDTSTIATPSAPTTKATSIWVDRISEVLPPKGIVNSAQLEKELCRMLANAVMYNPDPRRGFGPHFPMTNSRQAEEDDAADMQDRHDLDDGRLVNDAREMFESMEQAVAAWRAAERIRPGEVTGKSGNGDKADESTEDAAENTGAEDGEGEKGSLRRSARG